MELIKIRQEMEHKGNRDFKVILSVETGEDVETIEFNYFDVNSIYPLYNSLISFVREVEDAHIELETCNPNFASEISGRPNRNSTLLRILKDTQEMQGITIEAE